MVNSYKDVDVYLLDLSKFIYVIVLGWNKVVKMFFKGDLLWVYC